MKSYLKSRKQSLKFERSFTHSEYILHFESLKKYFHLRLKSVFNVSNAAVTETYSIDTFNYRVSIHSKLSEILLRFRMPISLLLLRVKTPLLFTHFQENFTRKNRRKWLCVHVGLILHFKSPIEYFYSILKNELDIFHR